MYVHCIACNVYKRRIVERKKKGGSSFFLFLFLLLLLFLLLFCFILSFALIFPHFSSSVTSFNYPSFSFFIISYFIYLLQSLPSSPTPKIYSPPQGRVLPPETSGVKTSVKLIRPRQLQDSPPPAPFITTFSIGPWQTHPILSQPERVGSHLSLACTSVFRRDWGTGIISCSLWVSRDIKPLD